MKKFKDLIEADAKDYKGDGESQKDYDTAGSDEEKFKQLHFTHNADLAKMGREHPVAPDYVFTGERPGGTKGNAGADHKGYEKPGEPILKTYKDFIASMRSAAKSGGDKAPVMQGSSKIKEEVELNEKQKPYVSSDRDGKHVMNAAGKIVKSFKDMASANAYLKKNYNKLMKEEVELDEAIDIGKPYRIRTQVGGRDTHVNVKVTNYKKGPGQKDIVYFKDADGKSGQMPAKVFKNRMKEEVELVDEAFKKGMLKLKDGKTVKIDEKTAKFLNNAMKQLNPGNRKKMETEAMKDKKSFEAMVDFAKAAA